MVGFFFPSRKTLILLVMLATVCVAKGRSPAAVSRPSSFACRGRATHFREGEPRLRHAEPPEAGHARPEKGGELHLHLEGSLRPGTSCFVGLQWTKSTGISPFLYSVAFYPISCLFIVFHFILPAVSFIHPVW